MSFFSRPVFGEVQALGDRLNIPGSFIDPEITKDSEDLNDDSDSELSQLDEEEFMRSLASEAKVKDNDESESELSESDDDEFMAAERAARDGTLRAVDALAAERAASARPLQLSPIASMHRPPANNTYQPVIASKTEYSADVEDFEDDDDGFFDAPEDFEEDNTPEVVHGQIDLVAPMATLTNHTYQSVVASETYDTSYVEDEDNDIFSDASEEFPDEDDFADDEGGDLQVHDSIIKQHIPEAQDASQTSVTNNETKYSHTQDGNSQVHDQIIEHHISEAQDTSQTSIINNKTGYSHAQDGNFKVHDPIIEHYISEAHNASQTSVINSENGYSHDVIQNGNFKVHDPINKQHVSEAHNASLTVEESSQTTSINNDTAFNTTYNDIEKAATHTFVEDTSGSAQFINNSKDIPIKATSDFIVEDADGNPRVVGYVDDFDEIMEDAPPLPNDVTSNTVEDTPGNANDIFASNNETHGFTDDVTSNTVEDTPGNVNDIFASNNETYGFTDVDDQQAIGTNDQDSFNNNVEAASQAATNVVYEENAILDSVVNQHISNATFFDHGPQNINNGFIQAEVDNVLTTGESSSAAKTPVPVPSFGHIPKNSRPNNTSKPNLCHKLYTLEEVAKMMEIYYDLAKRSNVRKKHMALIDWNFMVNEYNAAFPERMRSKNGLQNRIKNELAYIKAREGTPVTNAAHATEAGIPVTVSNASGELAAAGPSTSSALTKGIEGPIEEPKSKPTKKTGEGHLKNAKGKNPQTPKDKKGKGKAPISQEVVDEAEESENSNSIGILQQLNVFEIPSNSLFFSEEEIVYFTELCDLMMETYSIPLQRLNLTLLFNSFRYFRKNHHITPSPERVNGEIYKLYLHQIKHGIERGSLTLKRQAEYEKRMNLKPGTIHNDTLRLYAPVEIAERASAVTWVLLKSDPNIDLQNRQDLAEMFKDGEHPKNILYVGVKGAYPGLEPFSKSAKEWRELPAQSKPKVTQNRNRYATKDETFQIEPNSDDEANDEVIPEGHQFWEYLASEAIILRGLVMTWFKIYPGVEIDWKRIQICFNRANKEHSCCGRWRTRMELRQEWKYMYPQEALLIKLGRVSEVAERFQFAGKKRKIGQEEEEDSISLKRKRGLEEEEGSISLKRKRGLEEKEGSISLKRKRGLEEENEEGRGKGKKPRY
ncbi:hypothetical protein K440DRAFT_645949 [Wilcoxina mikolae CBS 423.85]|nr:hypothetical protein K440DRAFT_645949 [Wilcoxina mikolae CBS 423.85]